jgi:uncharacterized protein (DUF1330 family)
MYDSPHVSRLATCMTSSLLVAAGCASPAGPSATPPDAPSAPVDSSAPATPALELDDARVIELAFVTIDPAKQAQLFEQYFPQVLPIVGEYGGRALASFTVAATVTGDDRAQSLALFEWPSVDTFAAIGQDERVQELLPIRNEALLYINEANFFRVPADTKLALDPGRLYEVAGFWPTAAGAGELDDVMDQLDVLAARHGGRTVLELAHEATSPGTYRPGHVRVREWPDRAAWDAFAADDDGQALTAQLASLLEQHDRRLVQLIPPAAAQ